MQPTHFNSLATSLIASGTRRGVVRRLATLSLPAVLAALAGEEELAAHKRHKHRKKKCAKAGQAPSKKRKHCCKGLGRGAAGRCAATCASQGEACAASQLCVSGVCQPCDVCASGCPFSSVQAAIDAASAGASITLCSGAYKHKVVIAKDLTLIGAGDGEEPTTNTILTPGGLGSVVTVNVGVTVTLQRLRITSGIADSGAGISNINGTLTLNECTVSDNEVSSDGGGILNNTGKLTLNHSIVRQNAATFNGGGIANLGGVVTLNASTVSGNSAANGNGGGIINQGSGSLTLHGSTVTLNHAGGKGGGIENLATVKCDVTGSVSGNSAMAAPNCSDSGGPGGCDTCNPYP